MNGYAGKAPVQLGLLLGPVYFPVQNAGCRQQELENIAAAKLEDLQTRYGQLKSDLQQQLEETRAMVADLQPSTVPK